MLYPRHAEALRFTAISSRLNSHVRPDVEIGEFGKTFASGRASLRRAQARDGAGDECSDFLRRQGGHSARTLVSVPAPVSILAAVERSRLDGRVELCADLRGHVEEEIDVIGACSILDPVRTHRCLGERREVAPSLLEHELKGRGRIVFHCLTLPLGCPPFGASPTVDVGEASPPPGRGSAPQLVKPTRPGHGSAPE